MLARRSRPFARRSRLIARTAAALVVCAVAFPAVSALASSSRSVKVADSYFSVKHVTISRGTKVRWIWNGVLYHNVKVKSGPVKFHSPTQVAGSYSYTFSRRGTYVLYCQVHPGMKMTVVVR